MIDKITFLVFVSCIPLLTCGCVTTLQTSARLLEDREYEFYANPYERMDARELNGVVYLKYPVVKYVRKHTLARVCIPPSSFGGWHLESSENVEGHFVWLKLSKTSELEYAPEQKELDQRLKIAKKAEVDSFPFAVSHPQLFFGMDGSPDRMYTSLPLLETKSENTIPRIILAYTDGVLIDFPASVIMTLTGSFWYIPLTK